MSLDQFDQGTALHQQEVPMIDPSLQKARLSPRRIWEILKIQLGPFSSVISLACGTYKTWDDTTIEFIRDEMQ